MKKILFLAFFSTIITTTLTGVDVTSKVVYELAAQNEKTHYADGKLTEEEIKSLAKDYDKLYLDGDKYSKNELTTLLKVSRKVNAIVSDRTLSRWDIGRFMVNFKGRIMASSSCWEAWHVCRLAEQRTLIFVDGTRFGYWDLQKIITAGGYVLIDDRQIGTPHLKRLSDIAPSKVVVIKHSLSNEDATLLQEKGVAVFSEGGIARIEVSAKGIRHAKVEEVEENQPRVEEKKPVNWLEGISLW